MEGYTEVVVGTTGMCKCNACGTLSISPYCVGCGRDNGRWKRPEFSPLPWQCEDDDKYVCITAADGGVVLSDNRWEAIEGAVAYIVRCVNEHDMLNARIAALQAENVRLRSALERIVYADATPARDGILVNMPGAMEQLRAALADE